MKFLSFFYTVPVLSVESTFFDLKSSFGGPWLVLDGFWSDFGAQNVKGTFDLFGLFGVWAPKGTPRAPKTSPRPLRDTMLMTF